VAAIAHTIVCVFWFHPLVWWIARRMLIERETACDELVLRRGVSVHDYAAGILKVCRMSFAGQASYAAVNGSNLKDRMEHIMNADLNRTTSRAARALLTSALGLIALAPIAGGFLRAQQTTDSTGPRAVMVQVGDKMKAGQKQEALELLQAESAKHPERIDLRMAMGNTAVRAGQYDLAIATFQDVLARLDPNSTQRGDLYLRLGETYRRKGDINTAIVSLRQAKRILPQSTTVIATLALVLEVAGNWREAEQEYRTVLQLDARNGVAMNNLAYLLSQANRPGDLDEAMELAERAHELLPELWEVSDTQGWIYLKKNYPNEAIGVLEPLVESQPQHSTYRYHLAMAYAQKGLKTTAAEQLKKALECNPGEEEKANIVTLLEGLSK